jgi:hypothetical protein
LGISRIAEIEPEISRASSVATRCGWDSRAPRFAAWNFCDFAFNRYYMADDSFNEFVLDQSSAPPEGHANT